jgi:hypothetical protein
MDVCNYIHFRYQEEYFKDERLLMILHVDETQTLLEDENFFRDILNALFYRMAAQEYVLSQ